MCLDKGYDYEEVRDLLREVGLTAHIRPRGEEAKAIKRQAGFKARRSRGGTGPFLAEPLSPSARAALDKKPQHYLAFLHFACGLIAFRAAGLFG